MWIFTFFLRFVVIFSEFFEQCSVLRVSPDTDSSRRDRSVSVPAESAAETATVNHDCTILEDPMKTYTIITQAICYTDESFRKYKGHIQKVNIARLGVLQNESKSRKSLAKK